MGDPFSRSKDSPDIGTGGPGYTLAPEIGLRHTAGSVAMGRLPDRINPSRLSNGSQFYVALKALPELDGTDTVFGKVESGLEVLAGISEAAADNNAVPLERVVLKRTRLVPRERLERELASWSEAAKKTPSWWQRNPRQVVAVLMPAVGGRCFWHLRGCPRLLSLSPKADVFSITLNAGLGASGRLKKTCAICSIWKGWEWLF
jgi:cyclophilin family peptidyl-prolyl cis-trans isomerase